MADRLQLEPTRMAYVQHLKSCLEHNNIIILIIIITSILRVLLLAGVFKSSGDGKTQYRCVEFKSLFLMWHEGPSFNPSFLWGVVIGLESQCVYANMSSPACLSTFCLKQKKRNDANLWCCHIFLNKNHVLIKIVLFLFNKWDSAELKVKF